jgi:hypothetical protein
VGAFATSVASPIGNIADVNATNVSAQTGTFATSITAPTLSVSNVNILAGGAYRIDGKHLLSTPVNASSVALCPDSAPSGQGSQSVAVGSNAGNNSQQTNSVAVGPNAGRTNQGTGGVAVGQNAGQTNQGTSSVAIGSGAGQSNLGANSICIGPNTTSSFSNCIVLGNGAQADANSQLVLGSSGAPLATTTAGVAVGRWLRVRVNGTNYKLALYN